jgi:amino acid adenylation domain-containing protein/non-ribosomal peptide synthase protein (TIGR01720 family)
MQTSDYALLATSEAYRDVAAFWRRALDGLDDAVEIGSASDVTPRQQVAVPLGPAARRAIDALSDDSLGRFTVATAAIALAIARYFNRTSTLLRTPLLAGGDEVTLNPRREVPLVFTAASDASLRTFLEGAAAVVEESYSLQDYPVHILLERERGLDPSAASAFSLSSAAVHDGTLATRAPVHFDLDALDDGRIAIDFDPAAVEPFIIDGLAPVVAAAMARFGNLEETVGTVERVPAEQRERLLVDWNRTRVDYSPFVSAHRLFEQRVASTPDASAVRFGASVLSYRELDHLANRLAHALLASTGDRGPLVGIWMDRSPWLVVAVLGVLKAGLAYLPIDADVPAERLAFILRDSGVRRLLVDDAKAAAAAALGCTVIHADREQQGATTSPAIEVAPSDLAYVIYTSGSTGQPKGCQIEHHSLANYLRWANGYYWSDPGTGSMGLFTPLSFDLTVPSLFCPLLRGRTLVVYPQDAPIDEVLRQQFEAGSGIDAVKLTPSHIRLLESQPIESTGVRLAIVGGEALTPQQVALLHRLDARIRVINEYGPTEATVGCIVKEIAAGGPIVIGTPIANTQVYVLDEQQQPVAIGIRGEICIGGEGLARGYHARPELDAARFVSSPLAPGGRIYRTGDIGRWLPTGELECFGRLDGQMKIRGHRIEAGEVESALRHCEGVREAVAVAHAGEDGAELVAYVVTATGTIDAAAVRRTLRGLLPEYMVPTALVALDALPLTSNGKVDRRRLPSPASVQRDAQTYHAPRTDHERVLAQIWAEVFRLDRVGVDEDFFELGGHSLRAMAMLPRIHQELGVDVSVGEVLAHPTIAALAALVATKAPAAAHAIARVPPADHYAVSHGQQRLWVISRIDEDSAAYNVSSAFDLRGALDLAALQRAFDALIERHESLRTVFVEVDDEPRQRVLAPFPLPIELIDVARVDDAGRGADPSDIGPGGPGNRGADLSGPPDTDQIDRLRTIAEQHASAPFDLARGPLLRVAVCRMDRSRSVLLLTLHHIVSDEWSMRVLISEVVQLYHAQRTGAPAALPPLPVQYKDYAAWQRQRLASDEMRAHRDYWVTKLGGPIAALDLPSDRPRPAVQTSRGRHLRVTLDARTRARLRALGAAHGASPFMVLVAAIKVLLYRYTGESDVCIGSPIAGRLHADLTNQIGFYVNMLVLRDELRGTEAFGDLLARVKRTAEEAYEHQAFPFDRLVDALDVPRDLSRSPLFDVMVTYEGASDADVSATGITVDALEIDSGVSKFDLTFAFAESAQELALEIEYNTDLFDHDRIRRMSGHLLRLIDGVLDDRTTPIDRLELAGPGEEPVDVRPKADEGTVRPKADTTQRSVPPRDERERQLAGVLETVLGRTGLRTGDNYFYVGGDSIKAIQVVNRLARQGWTLRVRDLFEAPRLEDLARRMTASAPARVQHAVGGDVPLTPIQRWFFLTQPDARGHFNQSVMLRFVERLDETVLRRLAQAIVGQHDGLRLRYRVDATAIVQVYGDPYDPVCVHDLRGSADPVRDLERHATAAQASLDLERGPLVRFVLFRMPDGDRLLAIVHHLVVDGVSWRILLEDLRTGLAQASRGEAIDLGPKSDSFQAWSLALQAHAPAIEAERRWWESVEQAPACRLPYDREAVISRESDVREEQLTLSKEDTTALLTLVHRAYNTRVNDVLLAALARAVREWAEPGALRVDIEGHGRDGLDDVDVSRTVGWFTTLYPVVLDVGDEQDPGRQLTTVKELLRRVPGHGLGYGLLRGGRPSGAAVLFNFLGQFDEDLDGFVVADEPRGPERAAAMHMTHDLEIGGVVAQQRLMLSVRYSSKRFDAHTIARLVANYRQALDEIIAHCLSRTTTERTASDFRYHDATTAALVARLGAGLIEDVYPLSPMQQGMLYHSVLAADGSPAYVEQFTCAIDGPLDAQAFRTAWKQVIARHTALRTAVFWTGVEQPVQVVFTRVDMPWSVEDWRDVPAADRERRFAQFAATDRARGIRLDEPPLARCALIRVGDAAWRFVWTSHHLLLDGWSTGLVLQEVFACYEAAVTGSPASLPPARPYGEYIDWLGRQDAARADAYWRQRLHGFSTPTPLPAATPAGAGLPRIARTELRLTDAVRTQLADRARDHRLTLNTVVRGTWALLLAAHARRQDVVFGATVAGRPGSLPEVERIVGLFINTLPIRVRVERDAPLVDWLHRLQIDQADLDQFSYSALADVQRASGVPHRTPLFETLLVFQNYEIDESLDPASSGLAVERVEVSEETNYPLTVVVVPSDGLLALSYDTSRYDEASARALLLEVEARLEAFARDPRQTVEHALTIGRGQLGHVERTIASEDATVATEATAAPAARRYVPPRNAVERRLVRIWEQVLGHTAIGVTDDFFDLGGHSILAMKLVSAIQIWFDRAVPLADLLAHPTIERLAETLQREPAAQAWSPLVEIARGGVAPPLFLLPGAGGNIIYFHALAEQLSPTRAVYGLQAVGLDGHTPPLRTVEAIAARNVDEIRRAWPSGPYLLAGHSFGGQVALEMAQQLARQGQTVGLLAIFDTAAPVFEPLAMGIGWQDAHWVFKVIGEIEAFFGIGLGLTLDDLLPLSFDAQVGLVADRMQRAGVWAAGADVAQLRGYVQVYKANTQAPHARYDAPARVPIALFKALERDPDIEEVPQGLIDLTAQRDWGWDRFAQGDVAVTDVPGAHLSMLASPHVTALAQALDRALAAADLTWRSSNVGDAV